MSNLTVSKGRRKPVHSENLSAFPEFPGADSCDQFRSFSAVDIPAAPRPFQAKPLPVDPSSGRLEQLLDEDPPMAVVKVWRVLDRMSRWSHGGRGWNRCSWPAMSTIAQEAGLSYNSIRCQALPWLRARGWIGDERAIVDGEIRQVFWALWLVAEPGRPAVPSSVERAMRCAPSEQGCAQPIVDNGSNELKKLKKTTDGESSSFSFVRIQEPEPVTPPAPPVPEPILLDPVIEAELQGVESAADRAIVRASANVWAARFGVDLVVKAIIALRLKRAADQPIGGLEAWIKGVLANKAKEQNSTKATKLEAARLQAENRRKSLADAEARQAAAKRTRIEEASNEEAKQRELLARWENLDPSERDFVEQEARRICPFAFRPGSSESGRRLARLGVLEQLGA